MQAIRAYLRNFKLAGMFNSLDERVAYAKEQSLPYLDFLNLLLEDEANNRQDNSYKKRYSKAKLPAHKRIEDFDFSFQPSIDKKIINDCLTCQFIKEKKNIAISKELIHFLRNNQFVDFISNFTANFFRKKFFRVHINQSQN